VALGRAATLAEIKYDGEAARKVLIAGHAVKVCATLFPSLHLTMKINIYLSTYIVAYLCFAQDSSLSFPCPAGTRLTSRSSPFSRSSQS
jgi:hypothetical protein